MRTNVDPVSLEVVGNYLVSSVREMCTTLRRAAYSTILRESLDCSTAIFDPKGQLIGQADHVPSHQGSLSLAARQVAREFELDPGDVVIMNHPYQGGTHHPDIMIFKPVFHRKELVAITGALGHQIDVGGRSPGSVSTDARDVFEEGIMIPPMKLYRRGNLVPEIMEMIGANIRVPSKTLGDIRAEIAAVNVGERRFQELAEKHGNKALRGILAALLDRSEALMRQDLRKLPNGTYRAEGFLDDDGIGDDPVRIAVAVTLKDGDVTVDFDGTSKQIRGPFNCALSSVHSAVFCGVRYMTNPAILQNEGCYRPITLVLPEGTVVKPIPPAPLSGRFQTLERIADTIILAFNQARGDDQAGSCHACITSFAVNGREPQTDRPFVAYEIFGGGWGGTKMADGLDATYGLMGNCFDTPIEAVELEYPLRVERYELARDSGGAGMNRGGVGIRRDTRYLHGEGYCTNRSEVSKFAPKGVLGGAPAGLGVHVIHRADGKAERLKSKATNLNIKAGEVVSMTTPGGGGYGKPTDRDPARVLDDVLDGRVSIEAARELYGVVIDVAKGEVDEAATAARRRAMAA
jgi:N-methylhydantoinase B